MSDLAPTRITPTSETSIDCVCALVQQLEVLNIEVMSAAISNHPDWAVLQCQNSEAVSRADIKYVSLADSNVGDNIVNLMCNPLNLLTRKNIL